MARAAGAAALLAALLFVALLNLTPIHSSDFWIQLAVGDWIREHGEIPRTVLFTFTEARDHEFVAHEWLASLAWSVLYERVGVNGLVVFKAGAALALFGLAFALARQISRDAVVSIGVAALCLLLLNSRTRMRPELFAYLLALVQLNLLEAFRQSGRTRWLLGLPVAALLWANLHGSFLLGLALPVLFALGLAFRAEERGRIGPIAVAFAACVVASFATPHGLRLFSHALELGGNAYFRENILEWFPTFHATFHGRAYFVIWLAGLALLWVAACARWPRMDGTAWLLLGVFSLLSVHAIRHVGWLGIAAVPVLARTLPGSRGAPRLAAAALAVLLLGASAWVAREGNVRGARPGLGRDTPLSEELLAALRGAGLRGRVFNSYNLGDELVYHFHPAVEVVIDSRADAYGEAYHQRFKTLSGRSAQKLAPPAALLAFLDAYGVDTIVSRRFNVENWAARGHLAALAGAGWQELYRGPDSLVFRRGGAPD